MKDCRVHGIVKNFYRWLTKYKKYILGILLSLFIILCIVGTFIIEKYTGWRFDQNSVTICSCMAGIVATMFGLTAASYAFIWGDLRTEAAENRHLQKILSAYREKLWHKFVLSLVMTVLTIFISLGILIIVQEITDPSLYTFKLDSNGKLFTEYYNNRYFRISLFTAYDFELGLCSVLIMAGMNYSIFQRKKIYNRIVLEDIKKIEERNDLTKDYPPRLKDKKQYPQGEVTKIHNLEMIIDRIIENHESIGEAFEPRKRREKMLCFLFAQMLDKEYRVGNECREEDVVSERVNGWEYLKENKKTSLQKQLYAHAQSEYGDFMDVDLVSNADNTRNSHKPEVPAERKFLSVYEDMLAYRDNILVYSGENEKISIRGQWLRFTIKKRLLFFYMKGEKFDHMDLSQSSFSGADLRNTSFACCNLTGIKLKGANCCGTDFSGSKMTGMYFYDADDKFAGEIVLSCKDDGSNEWDPYNGKQFTYMEEASFADADISRSQLCASKCDSFSLKNANFDRAKMCTSLYLWIDFTNASFKRTQLFDSEMNWCTFNSADLTEAVLTHCKIGNCDFENANLNSAVLAGTVLDRENFHGANLMNANFSNSCICGGSFDEASCQNVSFKNAKLGIFDEKDFSAPLRFCYATITRTDFSGAILENTDFSNTLGANSIFTKTEGRCVNFKNAVLTKSVWNSGIIVASNFENTVLRNAVIVDSQFLNCLFWGTDFAQALFDCGKEDFFVGGIMCDVNFSGTVGLKASVFRNIVLKNVKFNDTEIKKSDFSNNVILIDCIFSEI